MFIIIIYIVDERSQEKTKIGPKLNIRGKGLARDLQPGQAQIRSHHLNNP